MEQKINHYNFGLKEDEIKKIREVLESFPDVDEAVIYGSRAKGILGKAQILILV